MKFDWKTLGSTGLAAWLLIAAPIGILSERAVTRSDRSATEPPSEPPAREAGAPSADGEAHGKRARQAAEDNWPEVEAFMSRYSPNKWKAYLKLAPAKQADLRAQLIARFNELSKLESNGELHELELKRVQIEDDLFLELSKRRQSHTLGEPYSPEFLKAVRSLVENRMDERKLRLKNLTELVKVDDNLKKNDSRFNDHVLRQARVIERNGLGAGAQGPRRRAPGQPATIESEEQVIPADP